MLVCWDIRLQRRVAVKCLPLHGGGDDVSTVEEGLAEARASSFLTHPNIVTVHDFEADDDYAYLVMEYVDGLTLAELMARVEGGVLIFDEVAHILKSTADALDYAHSMGVLHLDIKPANVMVSHDGTVKLADFGMASLSSAAGWNEARGGTVGYMPPEQLSAQMVDERSDVFSLGVVAYEALTGTSPFMADTPQASLKLIEKGAQPLEEVEPELEGPVAEAFALAMDPDPAMRMASPGELAGEVIPGLGDPEAGRESIAALLAQDGDEDEDFDEAGWRAMDPPGRRIPWLAGACARAVNGVSVGALGWVLAAHLGLLDPMGRGLCALIAGGLAAVWSPLGSMTALVLMVASLLFQGVYAPTFAIVALVVLLGCGWWGIWGREAELGPWALATGPVLGSPAPVAMVAAYGFDPVGALATGAVGSFLGALFGALEPVMGSSSEMVWQRFCTAMGDPGLWALVGASAAGAWLASLIGRRSSKGGAMAGELLCLTLVLVGAAFHPSLENDGIWTGPPLGIIFLAVVSTLFMLIVITSFGPPESRRERE